MTRPRSAAAVAALTLVLGLGACGDGTTDRDAITKIVNDGARDPVTICDHLSTALLQHFGSVDACRRQARKAARKGPQKVTIDRLRIDGDAATARVTGRDGHGTVTLVKDHGSWKVHDLTGGAR